MKKVLGKIKRGAIGIQDTFFEKAPPLPLDARKVLGHSFQGQDIGYYQIGTGNKKVLFVSAIHGNEVGTAKLAAFLIQWLIKTEKKFEKLTFYIIPCLNPDGQRLAKKNPDYFNDGRTGRLNARNVDLNRNFATSTFKQNSVWNHGENYRESTRVFCGESGNSEPETRLLTDFILNKGIGIYVGFHSAGRDVIGSEDLLGQQLAAAFSAATGYRLSDSTEWATLSQTGTAREWCEEHGVAYLEIEASARWGSDWGNQKPGIEAFLELLNK